MNCFGGIICVRFFENLSDRMLYFIHEDIEKQQPLVEKIREAQRLILKLVK